MLLNMARAEIRGGSKYPRIKGIVNFKQTGKGVLVTAKIYNLPTTIQPSGNSGEKIACGIIKKGLLNIEWP